MKFFLDNCLAKRLAPALHALCDGKHEVHHLQSRFAPSVKDVEWINALAADDGWVVISGDLRITKLPHERDAWLASGLTAFFLAKGWTNVGLWDQAWRIVRWWPRILEAAELVAPGAGFVVPMNFGDKGKFEQIRPAR